MQIFSCFHSDCSLSGIDTHSMANPKTLRQHTALFMLPLLPILQIPSRCLCPSVSYPNSSFFFLCLCTASPQDVLMTLSSPSLAAKHPFPPYLTRSLQSCHGDPLNLEDCSDDTVKTERQWEESLTRHFCNWSLVWCPTHSSAPNLCDFRVFFLNWDYN